MISGLHALPPGADFATEFVQGLIDRFRGQPPEALAGATVYLNSSRTLISINAAFARQDALLLPQLRLITDLGAGTGAPVVPPLVRRLQLARLVDALARGEGQGQNVPQLAASLSRLMAEMQSEGLPPEALNLIEAADHAAHWQRALAFLRIAAQFYLTGPPIDRESRQRATAECMIADWAEGRDLPTGQVIVAGSTGSHGATRLVMQAVAGLPNGAVVLPGFDFDQPGDVWDRLTHDGPLAEDHPQARYAPFVAQFGTPARWTDAAPPDAARNRLFSLALRPAPVTDRWITDGPALGDLRPATDAITLIEADSPAAEANAIALIIRDAVERGEPVTVMSSDRLLARRVESALDRWRLIADDSAGQPLSLTAAGLFLRHVAAIAGQALTPDMLVILLKHPLTATGGAEGDRTRHLRHARDLELHLRRNGPAFPDGAAMRDYAEHAAAKGQTDTHDWALWVAEMLDVMVPMADDRRAQPLAICIARHRALAEALSAGPGGDADVSELWNRRPGDMVRAVMDHLATHAEHGPAMTPAGYSELLLEQLQGQSVRLDVEAHPLIRFRGPREARTESQGLVVLAGLNEGSWPGALAPDPWLSRQMRRAAGLTLPERLVGLAAHDFQIAAGAARICLTRARRDADAQTIPSRWLNRVLNLIGGLSDGHGPEALDQMRMRGQAWIDMAAELERPLAPVPRAPRPAPIPPPGSLKDLSVTSVRTLIRDPYSIYARRVLRLNPLDPLRQSPDYAERGTVLHRIVQEFLTNPAPSPDDGVDVLAARLMDAADTVLTRDVPWPATRAFWRQRIASIAQPLVSDEHARLQTGAPAVIEDRGMVRLDGVDFRLTAKPDRIDHRQDGTAYVYDYKSGSPPTDAQIAAFDKQLPLEAAMIAKGAFGPLRDVSGFAYIQLGGKGQTLEREFSDELVDETWDGFVTLISSYLSGGRGFTARSAVEMVGDQGDYDHLARYGEWSASDLPQPRKVGHD
ncbi:MAG: double-strand break repair protein AddB [Paracoccus denitrificans]|nr:MAG: double-strand break repair protein AddB [Paracoccus denitrificans]PZO85482.1 MAG: double-strand break repair protein AddB [Paracoccus denitrificans]